MTSIAAHIIRTFFMEGLLRFLVPEGGSPQEKTTYIACAMDTNFPLILANLVSEIKPLFQHG
jgi:hypothetical protein